MIEALKPYVEYNESGVLWLEKIPKSWDLRRGKYLFRFKKELNSNALHKNVLSLTLRGVVNNNPDDPIGLVPKDYASYQLFRKNDLVFKLIDLENLRTSRVGLVHEDGIMSSAYIRLSLINGGNIRYFYYQFFDLYLRGVFNQLGAGVRATLGSHDLLDLGIALPGLDEQTQIVQFLDTQDRRINHLIRTKQRLIELLNEQKQVIIHRAVIRGIDPNVRLKPSGIEWIGDVPEHWEVKRSKNVFREVDARSTNGEETKLSMSQKLGLVRSSLIEERRLMSESFVGAKICEPGDLVLNRLKAHLGVFALASEHGLVSPDYTVFRAIRPICGKYFELAYRTPACRVELRKRAKGIVQGFWRLYSDDFYQIAVPIPPLDEQNRIIAQLDTDLATLNHTIADAHREIELLREFRTRLISDVVTGKLDVCGVELPAMDETETLKEIDTGEDIEAEELLESEEVADADE